MEIRLADNAGFCFGVRRAIQIAIETSTHKDKRIYTIGPIIHNPQMVKKLEEKGIFVANSLENLNEGDTVIIRSHGITYEMFQELIERKVNIIDATCPYVKTAQKHARELSEKGYQVIVVGEKNHPEVIGILSFATGEAKAVSYDDDLSYFYQFNKIGLVAQTTTRHEYLSKVACVLLSNVKELRIFNTICSTTYKRQEATKRLAEKMDAMVIVGGYNSANTNRLANICREMGKPTFHIETAEELDLNKLKNFDKVGVSAGASTPDWIIKEIIKKLESANVTS